MARGTILLMNWRPAKLDLQNTNFAVAKIREVSGEQGRRAVYRIVFKHDPRVKLVVVVNIPSGQSFDTSLPSPSDVVIAQVYEKVSGEKVYPVIQVLKTTRISSTDKLPHIKLLIAERKRKHVVVAADVLYAWVALEHDVYLAYSINEWPTIAYEE